MTLYEHITPFPVEKAGLPSNTYLFETDGAGIFIPTGKIQVFSYLKTGISRVNIYCGNLNGL
jgi:hypothetical protein